ncbi:MAG TPA: saccharopine dehydrogenase C-terminal domain-containing protein [Bacteroidota bacterium]|nr:saccharopine dehydrogenase C-terminal domain-containing protein [Bacteroidota bacterium]
MRVLVIGSGMMGSAAAYDLAHSEGVERVVLADIDLARAKEAADSIGPAVEPQQLDINDPGTLIKLMKRADAAIGATSYTHNVTLTKAAIAAKIHFCDLGGNMDVVNEQLQMNAEAKNAGVCILPNCGLAPGLACIVAAGAAKKFSEVHALHIRVGGLPQHPQPPLNYQLVFSAQGLINEYREPADVIRNGKSTTVPSMEELEELVFPAPFGTLEAFNTSGGVSTLPRMFAGKAREMDYKTIRYKGHCEKFKTLLDLGFASNEPVVVGNSIRTAREIFEELLRRKLPANGPDVVLMRVTVKGLLDGRKRTLAYEMIDSYDIKGKKTSMMRTTAYPTSIIAQMAVKGIITARGVEPPEQCVPLDPLIAELKKRDIHIHETLT